MQGTKVRRVATALQRRVREEIGQRNVSPEQLARKLGLLPVGAEVLLAREEWSLETAIQVAEAVGLEVELKVNPGE